ncbi:MAG: type I-C CRISPR-associated protein Cas8c/Csd1 [Rubrobacteraceae bacterium]
MILRRLVEYAERLEAEGELTPVMYAAVPVRWQINLKEDGTLEGFLPLGGDRKDNKRGNSMVVPNIVRAAGIKPKLLVDNGEYVLGIGRSGADAGKVADRHSQFVELVHRCAEETEEESVGAVTTFLGRWDEGEFRENLPDEFDPQDNVGFRVRGVFPEDRESVKSFWAKNTTGEDAPEMMCLITGNFGPVEQRLPVKVKGLTRIGGQAAGTSLISANAEPFESYGLKNSLTSPISRDAGERFGKALNHLLADEKSNLFIGPSVYVFWTREHTGFDFASFLSQPEPETVRGLLKSPFSGHESHGTDAADFYALSLSASGGRAVVRDWLQTTVPDAQENLKRWFRAQRIVDTRGEAGNPLGLFPLAAGAYRDAGKEMTPQVPAALVRAAIKGGRVPEDLLARAVRRNRSEGDVSRQRAALMKLVLIYGGETMAETLEELNPQMEDPAYHCGRLLAELEELQRAAIPGVKATIVDRYYGAASSTPASVFGTLMRNHSSHVGKIRKERPGVGVAIQDRIGEITEKIGAAFPTTLTMRQQAIFALGFYHQRAHNRAEAKAAREARDNKEGNQE